MTRAVICSMAHGSICTMAAVYCKSHKPIIESHGLQVHHPVVPAGASCEMVNRYHFHWVSLCLVGHWPSAIKRCKIDTVVIVSL